MCTVPAIFLNLRFSACLSHNALRPGTVVAISNFYLFSDGKKKSPKCRAFEVTALGRVVIILHFVFFVAIGAIDDNAVALRRDVVHIVTFLEGSYNQTIGLNISALRSIIKSHLKVFVTVRAKTDYTDFVT